MNEAEQENSHAGPVKEPLPGWWSSGPSQPGGESGFASTSFFDQPPLIFAALIWGFPYSYFYFCMVITIGIANLFKAFGATAADYISLISLQTFFSVVPLLFFAILLIKGRWFLNNLLFLLLLWLVLVLSSGLTQGGLIAGFNRAYGISY